MSETTKHRVGLAVWAALFVVASLTLIAVLDGPGPAPALPLLGMAVTANQVVKRQAGCRQRYAVAAAKTIYEGTLVFLASGYATDAIAAGANAFAGIAVKESDNSGGSAGDTDVECETEGVFELEGSGFTQANVGALAYASDNYTVTTTSASMTKIGRIVEYVSATKVRVKIDVQQA